MQIKVYNRVVIYCWKTPMRNSEFVGTKHYYFTGYTKPFNSLTSYTTHKITKLHSIINLAADIDKENKS
jgi:hypothetical protein